MGEGEVVRKKRRKEKVVLIRRLYVGCLIAKTEYLIYNVVRVLKITFTGGKKKGLLYTKERAILSPFGEVDLVGG